MYTCGKLIEFKYNVTGSKNKLEIIRKSFEKILLIMKVTKIKY